MFIDRFEIVNNKYLNAGKIESVVIDIDKPILVIIGDNGSGKSSMVREITPWPAIQTDYLKGFKKVQLTHQGKQYTIASDFKKGICHKFIVDGEDLNKGNTGANQKELCEHHLQFTQFIDNVISAKFSITSIIPTERRNLFFKAYPFMNEILDMHKKIVTIIRANQSNLKMLIGRKTELLTTKMDDKDIVDLTQRYNSFKIQLNEIEKIIYSLNIEIKKLREEITLIKTSPFFRVLTTEEVVKKCSEYNRSVYSSKRNLMAEYGTIINHSESTNSAKSEKSILEYKTSSIETQIASIRDEINKFESYLNVSVGVEKDVLLLNIQTTEQILKELIIDSNLPVIQKNTVEHFERSVISELEQNLVFIKQYNGKLYDQKVIQRAQSKLQDYTFVINHNQQQISFFEKELESLVELRFTLPPDNCIINSCSLRENSLSIYKQTTDRIESIKNSINNLLKKNEIFEGRCRRILRFVEASNACRANIEWIENTFYSYDWYSDFLLNKSSLIFILNHDPFVLLNRIKSILKNSKFILLKQEHEASLKTDLFKLEIINKTPSRKIIDESLLDRQVKLKHLTSEYAETTDRLKQVATTYLKLMVISEAHAGLTELNQQWDVYSKYSLLHETLIWNEEFLSKAIEIKNNLTDNLVSTEIVIQQQNNIAVRLNEEINPSIEKIEAFIKEYALIEKALSPSVGIPKPNMIEFINNIIDDMNYYLSRIMQLDTIRIKTIDTNTPSVNYLFPVTRNDSLIPDISTCSKSQKSVIDLCFNLSLYKQLGLNNNYPLLLDEPDDGFSEGNRTRLLVLLSDLVDEGHIHQLVIISHFASMLSGFEKSSIVCLNEENILLPTEYNTCCVIN